MLRMLRLPAVKDRTGHARSTIYSQVKTGLFPPPIALGKRAVGWWEDEIDAVLAARIAAASEGEIRTLVCELLRRRTAR
jgi:prophage regulatory protein